jgi:hypothetical protein
MVEILRTAGEWMSRDVAYQGMAMASWVHTPASSTRETRSSRIEQSVIIYLGGLVYDNKREHAAPMQAVMVRQPMGEH